MIPLRYTTIFLQVVRTGTGGNRCPQWLVSYIGWFHPLDGIASCHRWYPSLWRWLLWSKQNGTDRPSSNRIIRWGGVLIQNTSGFAFLRNSESVCHVCVCKSLFRFCWTVSKTPSIGKDSNNTTFPFGNLCRTQNVLLYQKDTWRKNGLLQKSHRSFFNRVLRSEAYIWK